MGILGCVGKLIAVGVALLAVLLGAVMSGALRATGIFGYVDRYHNGRGLFFKGFTPATHDGVPWGFRHEDIPNLKGDTILVTGGNVGLGYWTVHHLAAHDAHVIMGCRSEGKCKKAAAEIEAATGRKVETALMDLGSFASIRKAAAALAAKHPKIDSLVLNAGVMVPPFTLTEDGLELQIGTNHFGHHLLTKLLLPQLEAAASAKGVATVSVVSSAAHFDSYPEGILPSIERMNDEKTYDRAKAYGQSKLANVLFAQELAERVKAKNILVNVIHPGGVDTDLSRHFVDMISVVSSTLALKIKEAFGSVLWTPSDASLTQIYAAVSPQLKQQKITGKYFHPIARETTPDPHAQDKALQKNLWKMTEDFIAAH